MIDDRHHDKPATSRREPEGTAMLSAWPEADGWVCNVLVRRGDRLLVLRRSPGGYLGDQWDLPGGKSEPGEEPGVEPVAPLEPMDLHRHSTRPIHSAASRKIHSRS